MKTRMAQTSLEVYEKTQIETGKQRVLKVFKLSHQRFTAKQIAKLTGMELGTTTARINQLRYDDGKLTTAGEKDNETLYCINRSNIIDVRPLSNAEKILEELREMVNNGNVEFDVQNFINKWEKMI